MSFTRAIALVSLFTLSGCTIHTHDRPAETQASAGTEGQASVSSGASVVCRGGDVLTLEDRVIESAGNGVETHGACRVTLRRCRIKAGAAAIETHGKSRVTVIDSVLEGGHSALELHGMSRVELSKTQIKGKVDKHALATLEDLGQNRFE